MDNVDCICSALVTQSPRFVMQELSKQAVVKFCGGGIQNLKHPTDTTGAAVGSLIGGLVGLFFRYKW